MSSVQEKLAEAEQLLPGRPAPDGIEDARWQAIIEVAMFAEREPEAIWPFVLKWGSHEDEDVRAAIATCLLEDLLQYHFDLLFPRVALAARSSEFSTRVFDTQDQHVFCHPTLVAGDIGCDSKRKAFLAQQCIASISRTE